MSEAVVVPSARLSAPATPLQAGAVLPVARYRFSFRMQDELRLPDYSGSLLRGNFGAALRRTACMTGCPYAPGARSIGPVPTLRFSRRRHLKHTLCSASAKCQIPMSSNRRRSERGMCPRERLFR